MISRESVIVQRAYDSKWEKLEKFSDPENAYTYKDIDGSNKTLMPSVWVTTQVYDFLMEEVSNEK